MRKRGILRPMSTEGLEKAIDIAGGQEALAKRMGRAQSTIWTWLRRDGRVPAEDVIAVASAVDFAVTPHELRNDTYPYPADGLPPEYRQRVACEK